MALTRIEKALTMPLMPAPSWFQHSATPNKPAAPSTAFLDAADSQRYQLIIAQRENGTWLGWEIKNVSPNLQTALANFEAYVATPAYKAWTVTDILSREWQWKLSQVDIAEAVNSKATKPPSLDSLGVGTAAPSVNDVGLLGSTVPPTTPDYVSTGDPNAPELVFGDDGDIVTAS
jgi:hypothetical protein